MMTLVMNDSSDNTNDTMIVLLMMDMIITMMALADGSDNGNNDVDEVVRE